MEGDIHVQNSNPSRRHKATTHYQRESRTSRQSSSQTEKGVWIDWVEGIPARLYQITTKGQVWSTETESFLKPDLKKKYLEIDLKSEGFRAKKLVHRLVAHAFIGPPPPAQPEVNHISGDTHDNRVSNLEYVSRSENIVHRNEVLKSDKGGGVKKNRAKCPHCGNWFEMVAVKGRTD